MHELSRKEFISSLGKLGICGIISTCTPPRPQSPRKTAVTPYQRGLAKTFHRWFCKTFFDFTPHLSREEHAYLDKAMALMDDWAYTLPQHDDISLSTMAYSHRVFGNAVNSSRLAYGSVKYQSALQEDIQKILQQRKILPRDIPDQDNISGLGWDIIAQQFKTYLYVPDLHSLSDPLLKEMLHHYWNAASFHPFGGVSYTFIAGKKFETKLYLYPRRKELAAAESPLPVNSQQGLTHMVTSLRGMVPQIDINDARFDPEILNDQGKKIYAHYQEKNWPLDTIAYHDKERYTLYF